MGHGIDSDSTLKAWDLGDTGLSLQLSALSFVANIALLGQSANSPCRANCRHPLKRLYLVRRCFRRCCVLCFCLKLVGRTFDRA